MWSDLTQTPRAVLLAHIALVAPLFVGALALLFSAGSLHYTVYVYMMFYAPLPLVFTAASQAGLAIARGQAGATVPAGPLVVAVTLTVVAWLAITIPGPVLKLILLMLGFGGAFAADIKLVRDRLAPPWFAGLRKAATLVVLISLGLSALAIIDQVG